MHLERSKKISDRLQRLCDRSLVIRFQAGDDAAFEEIVAEMHGRLRQFVTHSFRLRPVDVEDLLQDVWLAACGGLRRLRQPASLRAWLYRVARNKALKHLRRRRPMADLDGVEIEAPSSDETATDRASHAELQAALAALSVAHREVVVLRFEEGLSYDDIAHAVGCPVGTVRSRLHYAKTVLQNKLGRYINDDQC